MERDFKDRDIIRPRGEPIRVKVNFSEGAFSTLQQLSEQTRRPMGEVLRDAIELKQWWTRVHKEGARILIDRRNGWISEVVKVE